MATRSLTVRSGPCRRRLPWIGMVSMVVAAGLAVPPAPAGAAAAGTVSTLAGGLGSGPATNVGQLPRRVAVVGEFVVEIDGPDGLPGIGGGWYPMVVRAIDLRSGRETPIAGNEYAGGYSADGGVAVGSPLAAAYTVVGAPLGGVYLSEGGSSRIRVITPSGIINTIAGTGVAGFAGDGGPAKAAQLSDPAGMAIASDGSLVFADRGNNRVRRVDSSGVISTIAGTGAAGSAGDGGPAALAQLSGPSDLGFDALGNLYIAEKHGDRIRMMTPAGTISTFARTALPLGLAVTPAGTVLVPSGSAIKSINAAGVTTVIAGIEGENGFSGDGGPATAARLANPRGIALDARGNIYVADSNNNRVRKIGTDGVISTIGGNGRASFGGDGGPGPHGQLGYPTAVTTGPYGTYIVDGKYENIRHVDPAGTIRTVGGVPATVMTADRAGNLYLREPGRVVKRTPGGSVTVLATGGAAGTSEELIPRALAVDGSGNLYIANNLSGTTTILRVGADGVMTAVAGAKPLYDTWPRYPEAALHSPVAPVSDMAVGPDGTLYAATMRGIVRFSCGIASALPIEGHQLPFEPYYGPEGMAVDQAGNIFFAVLSKVFKVRPDGKWAVVAGGGTALIEDGRAATSVNLGSPVSSLSLDDAGNLLVATSTRVLKVHGVSAGAAIPGPACNQPAVPTDPPASYQPLAPARILDTRNGTGGFTAAVGPGATIGLNVTGVGGVPATGVSAVALNVTVTEPAGGGYLTLFPSGTARPTTSSINFLTGQTVANMAVAKVGGDGKVSIFNAVGTTHVVVDVVGWYGANGSRFNSLVPARILDTRYGTGGFNAAVGPAATIALPVTGVGGVPATGVSAVVLNVTATQPSGGGYLTLFPSGTARPTTSSINFLTDQTVANMAVAKVGGDGKVSIFNAVGSTHVVVDVVGWYGDQGSRFHSLAPARLLDTRNGTGGFPIAAVAAGATIYMVATTIGGLPDTGVSAVVLNVTVTEPARGGFLTLFPSTARQPETSSINFTTGQTVANLTVSQIGAEHKVAIYNGAGATHVVVDVVGWYGPPA